MHTQHARANKSIILPIASWGTEMFQLEGQKKSKYNVITMVSAEARFVTFA